MSLSRVVTWSPWTLLKDPKSTGEAVAALVLGENSLHLHLSLGNVLRMAEENSDELSVRSWLNGGHITAVTP